KKPTKLLKKPVPGKVAKKKRPGDKWRSVEWVAVGADVSMSTISVAGLARIHGGGLRHGAFSIRWAKDDDYFKRMKEAAKAHEAIQELFRVMKVMPELNDVYIAVEEAVSFGHLQRAQSAHVKQQIQISGAFIGGLLRW